MRKSCLTCKHAYPVINQYCADCHGYFATSEEDKYNKWEPIGESKMKINVEETKEPKMPYHERLIEDLKAAGQSIIDNAESIIGSERYLHQVRVMITLNPSEATMVNVDRDFYPEGIIK